MKLPSSGKLLHLGVLSVTLFFTHATLNPNPESVSLLTDREPSLPVFCPLSPFRLDYTYWRQSCVYNTTYTWSDPFCDMKRGDTNQSDILVYHQCWKQPDSFNKDFCPPQNSEFIPVNKSCLRQDCGILTEYVSNKTHVPWQAKIFKRPDRLNPVPWCVGTIISATHIITAARCFESAEYEHQWDAFFVKTGQELKTEPHKLFAVKKVHFPPSGFHKIKKSNPTMPDGYVGDIAIVELVPHIRPQILVITFTPDVTPSCLWEDDGKNNTRGVGIISKYNNLINNVGIWQTSAVTLVDCKKFYSNGDGSDLYSDKLCSQGEISVDFSIDPEYNTGIGYYEWTGGTQMYARYQLRGIFSSTFLYDINQYQGVNIYTDVSKYLYWIKKIIGE